MNSGMGVLAIYLLLFSSSVRFVSGASGDESIADESLLHNDTPVCDRKNTTLHIVVMAPFPDPIPELSPSWEGGPAVISGALLAAERINARCDILGEYQLELLEADSGCQVKSKATIGTVETLFYSNAAVIGIIGPGCSEATMIVGQFIAFPEVSLLNIAPSATSPELVNKIKYPNTFRLIASSLGFLNIHYNLIQMKQYNSVSILYEAERDVHVAASNSFQQELLEMGVDVVSYGMFDDIIPLSLLKNKYRVIFVFSGSSMSRRLMCLAYHMEIAHPDYQFIFSERRLSHFLNTNVSFSLSGVEFNCNNSDLSQSIQGVVLNLIQLTRSDTDTTLVDNMTFMKFEEDYTRLLDSYKLERRLDKVVDTEHHTGYYDSVWALALSFDAAMQRFEDLDLSLGDYELGNPDLTDIIRKELVTISFEGARGRVEFNSDTQDGMDVTVFNVFQVQGEEMVIVAKYNPTSEEKLAIYNSTAFIDGKFDIGIISPPLFVEAIVFIALAGMTGSTVFFHLVNTMWVRAKSLKVTSPGLNHMMFSGCYLYLLSILFLSLQMAPSLQQPVLFGVRCSGFIWCESIALTLIFATISVKLWRIYCIFSHKSAGILKNLEDYRLVGYVCILLLVDLVINVAWNAIDPWYKDTVAEVTLQTRVICNCNNLIIWLSVLMVIKIMLLLVVFYLSIITRRIPKREYKQTKSVTALIYSLIFLYCFTIPIHLIFLGKTSTALVTVSYLALCFKNFVCIILCTVFIFLPPVLPIFREKYQTLTVHWSLSH